MKKSAARRRVASFDASILGCGTADRAGGKSVSLGRFKNCKPLNLKPLRHHGVEDELGYSQGSFPQFKGSPAYRF